MLTHAIGRILQRRLVRALSSVPSSCRAYRSPPSRIESNFNNQINLEIATEPLLQALRSTGKDAADVTMRLAKRDRDPLLSFSIGNTVSGGEIRSGERSPVRGGGGNFLGARDRL
jgi:hypothetical protein